MGFFVPARIGTADFTQAQRSGQQQEQIKKEGDLWNQTIRKNACKKSGFFVLFESKPQ